MPRINHLVFWVGGVITEKISSVTRRILHGTRRIDSQIQIGLSNLENRLCKGAIEPNRYCQEAIKLSRSRMDPATLADQLGQSCRVEPGIRSLLEELSDRCRLSLVSDWPRCWLVPGMHHSDLNGFFSEDDVFIVSEDATITDLPGLFDELVASGIIVPRISLWVDHHSLRASAAIRLGIDATLYVDTRRLHRDLVLWDLLPGYKRLHKQDLS